MRNREVIQIEASVLSADYSRLREQALEAEAAGADGIQVDVMDGRFVPRVNFGPETVRTLRPLLKRVIDVHLMVIEPERHIPEFAAAGADRLIIHEEACPGRLGRVLQSIRGLGVEAGVSINPGTPLSVLEGVWDLADVIQVMTVNPGLGGQPFLYDQVEKIRNLARRLRELGRRTPIVIDGGIDARTAPLVVGAGANILVAGSSIYNRRGSVADNLAALRASISNPKL
ncbi:MAG TPA: ribulose-phosphate 3-epimerase [Syntrophales bacterium]|nr:ribulose-phosphate 3-epimerase [Syntrophales bacterium]HPI57629.1 ribulose-phosphate 3-epimerase [Syntrophales bacterium]HPN25358.1 ribulose-phosphate 3-epimerase [Syntrophales bacterium]